MNLHVPWSAGPKSQQVVDALERTEDIMFSPSGERLAVAGFRVDRIAVFDVRVELVPNKAVRLTDVVEIESPGLDAPHGLCFLDDDTLAVANRQGSVAILPLPRPSGTLRHVVDPRVTLGNDAATRIETPGSVAMHPIDARTVELLVCNNYANTVTRHVLDRHDGFRVVAQHTLLAAELDTPDGICVSPDGRWIAVSNHNTHTALLYRRGPELNPRSRPDGVLLNVLCPHGLRFTEDAAHVLVADAGAPFVNVYARPGAEWTGHHEPSRLFPAMGRALFVSGQHNPQEGGPKGIDLDRRRRLLVATCETQTLSFFDLDAVLCGGQVPGSRRGRLLRWRIANSLFNRAGVMLRRAP